MWLIHAYSCLFTTQHNQPIPAVLKALQGIQLPNDGLQEGGLPRTHSADDTH